MAGGRQASTQVDSGLAGRLTGWETVGKAVGQASRQADMLAGMQINWLGNSRVGS